MSRKRRCGVCPKWYGGFCSVLAKRMVAEHESCAYGRGLMRNAYSAKWMAEKRARKRGAKKGDN